MDDFVNVKLKFSELEIYTWLNAQQINLPNMSL